MIFSWSWALQKKKGLNILEVGRCKSGVPVNISKDIRKLMAEKKISVYYETL